MDRKESWEKKDDLEGGVGDGKNRDDGEKDHRLTSCLLKNFGKVLWSMIRCSHFLKMILLFSLLRDAKREVMIIF